MVATTCPFPISGISPSESGEFCFRFRVLLFYATQEIQKTEAEISALSQKYEKIAEKLKALREQKQEYENRQIIEAFRESGKSLDEVLIFLGK